MLEINIQTAAKEDLIDIWKYSYERWGEIQADRYVDDLYRGIQTIAENPKIGMAYSESFLDLRFLSVNLHHVFYYLTDNSVEIVRVLYKRMDTKSHL